MYGWAFIHNTGLQKDSLPDLTAELFEEDDASTHETDCIPNESNMLADNKHTRFASEQGRQATFLTWPHTNNKSAEEMIDHFLFFTGEKLCNFSF